MQLDQTTLRAGAVAFVLLAPVAAPMTANAALVAPSGLSVGQGYRLAFLTHDGIDATSGSIATYNAFATAQASLNADLAGLSWTAIASTATTDAVNNINCAGCNDVPIYLVDGSRLANSTATLFAQDLLSLFNKDQYGLAVFESYAWTGSKSNGTKDAPLGVGRPNNGYPYSAPNWLDGGSGFDTTGTRHPIYAISSEAFVAGASTAVPEPATLALLGAGGLLALGARRRAGSTSAA